MRAGEYFAYFDDRSENLAGTGRRVRIRATLPPPFSPRWPSAFVKLVKLAHCSRSWSAARLCLSADGFRARPSRRLGPRSCKWLDGSESASEDVGMKPRHALLMTHDPSARTKLELETSQAPLMKSAETPTMFAYSRSSVWSESI